MKYIYILKLFKKRGKFVFAQHCSINEYDDYQKNPDSADALKQEFLAACLPKTKHYDWAQSPYKAVEICSAVKLATAESYDISYLVYRKKNSNIISELSITILLPYLEENSCPAKFFRKKIKEKLVLTFGDDVDLYGFEIVRIGFPFKIY